MPIANGVVQLLMLLKKLLQKNYRLLKSCLQQLYLNKIITQLLHLVFVFTPAANLDSKAKAMNSIANRTNSFANRTKSIANLPTGRSQLPKGQIQLPKPALIMYIVVDK